MEYVNLGRSGLKVSRACLGAMMFGTAGAPCEEAESRRIVDDFLDRGHNFIDTANVYTGGQSEEVTGRAIAQKRDSVVLATKGRFPQGSGPNDGGLSRVHLTRALEAEGLEEEAMKSYSQALVEGAVDETADAARAGLARIVPP